MLTLRRGRVTGVVERLEGLVRLEVDGEPCIAYPRLTGPVALGDDVVVNEQARALGLGSGGFDVLHANLTRGLGLAPPPGAHVMKLPYTPLQHAVRHAEEDDDGPARLGGMPVVCCSLHSQVVPVFAGLGEGVRAAYVQVPGGALPVSLSDALRALRGRGLLSTTVAVAACVDADVACVSTASALVWCAGAGFDVAVCAIGPGVVGTASPWGHGGLAAAEVALTARELGGRPVVVARTSELDPRARHRGLSHHTRAILALAGEVDVGWPAELDRPEGLSHAAIVDASRWREACAELPLEHMGRDRDQEPGFFATAFAAGALARSLLG